MPYKRGAPMGNTNRLKHGHYRAAALATRKLVRETIRSARVVLLQAQVELIRSSHNLESPMDKST